VNIGSFVESIQVTHARVRSTPTGGHRRQFGPASTGMPIHGVNPHQRSYREPAATTTGHELAAPGAP
jgi:hypothetical protein